jgi:Arabinose-binding domain of AraC transcription regulator, N-term
MREAGKGLEAVLSGAGLTVEEVDDPTARLEVRTQIKVLELAAQELQDDFLGFHLARSFDLREIGLHYYVMASSEQLAEGLRNAERYSGSASDGVLADCIGAYMPAIDRQPTSASKIDGQAFSR